MIQIPNKAYWAVFVVSNPENIHIPAMFTLKGDAEAWAKRNHYTKDEVMYKKVWALVSVV